MNFALQVCIVAVAFHFIAVPAFIYAIKTRQNRINDQEAFQTIEHQSSDSSVRPGLPVFAQRPVTRLRMVLFFGLIITMLVGMASAQVYLAFRAAHTPVSMEDPN
jgi:hypothetical protein